MGPLAHLLGRRLYLDTNIFIYALENLDPWGSIAGRIMQAIDAGECTAVTSELTLAECLVKPLQIGRIDFIKAYSDAIQPRHFLIVPPVDRAVLVRAAELRAQHLIKLPDAIHAATAILNRCELYLTNDQRLQSTPALKAIQLSEITAP